MKKVSLTGAVHAVFGATAVLVIALALIAGSSDVARANPDPVDAGHDLLETDPNNTSMDFSGTPIPADFFGPGSDPFSGSVNLEGVPLGSFGGFSGLGPADTIVERKQDAGLTGFPDTIDIEIVALHLQSVAPITVTDNGGQNPESWDVDVQLAPNQVQGTMTVRHENTEGGTFDADLPVKPLFTLTQVNPPNTVVVLDGDAVGLTIPFQATGENWCHDANPLHNPPFQWVIEKSGLTTNFFPGVVCEPETQKNYFAMDAFPLAVHAVQPAEVPAPHYKCYGIGGDAPIVPPVIIETQFGSEEVVVGAPSRLCLPAVKNNDVDLVTLQEQWPHIECYDISGQDPPEVVDLVTQFGLEENVEVGQAKLLCMPTLKEVWEPFITGSPPGPVPSAPHHVCYEIAPEPPEPAVAVNLLTQFTFEAGVIVDLSSFLCAPALKNGEGDLSMPHLKCYTITGPPLPVDHIVELHTQFGYESTGLVDPIPQLLCAPALKTLVTNGVGGIAGFPDIEEPAPGTADPTDGSSIPYALLAGGLAAAILAVVVGGWYARRRWQG